jgi:outer membrane protein TolC
VGVLLALALASASDGVRAQEAGSALTLAEAYKLALARSEATALSSEQVDVAEIEKRVTKQIVMPQAAITAMGVAERGIELPAMDVDVFKPFYATASAHVTQPLFRRGYSAASSAASKGIQAARTVQGRVAEALMLQVANAYLAVLRSRELSRTAEESVTRAEAQLNVTRARMKAGGALKTAEQLAAIELERAKLQVVNAGREEQAQAIVFEELIGKPPPKDLAAADLADVPGVDQCIRRLPEHGDVRTLRLVAEQSNLRTEAAHGRRWPTLDLQVGLDYYTYLFPLGDNVWAWNARAILNIPLFQGGAEGTDVDAAEARTRIATLRLEEREKQLSSEIRRSAVNLASADSAVTVAATQAQIALEHYNLITAQFKVGAVTFLDVANAQGVLTTAEEQRIRALYERETAKFGLLYACDMLKL